MGVSISHLIIVWRLWPEFCDDYFNPLLGGLIVAIGIYWLGKNYPNEKVS